MSWNNLNTNNRAVFTLFAFSILYLTGCSSSYRVPERSKVIVEKEKLPQYNPRNFSTQNKKYKLENEDELIIKAIWLEEQHNYAQSNKIYAKLYDATKQDEYLLKELTTAHYAGILSKNIDALKSYIRRNPSDIQAKRLLLSFNLKEKKFQEAKDVASLLTKESKQAIDYELAANPYIFTGDYQQALIYLDQAYKKTLNEDILLKIVTIEVNYLQDIDSAVERLEKHRKLHGCSEKICLQLIAIYGQQEKIAKLIPIYKDLAKKSQKEIYIEKVIEGYLFNKDIDGAINYLKTDYKNDELLYSLYMEKKEYKKAYALTQKILKTSKDPKWYAESAIAQYETLKNKDDKKSLNKIVKKFEKALELGVEDAVYLNYYGYTLIDKEIDVKKGIKIIKKVLKQEPENSYYMDSLAWGEYKLGNCNKAYPLMKKVVEIEGLNEDEIIEHWKAINTKCSKN